MFGAATTEDLPMRHTLTALALCAVVLTAGSEPARAEITYPWCAEYGGRDGGGQAPGSPWRGQQGGHDGGHCENWVIAAHETPAMRAVPDSQTPACQSGSCGRAFAAVDRRRDGPQAERMLLR